MTKQQGSSGRAALAALALFAASSATAAAQTGDSLRRVAADTAPLALPPVVEDTLTNGAPVAVMRDARQPLVSVGVVFDIDPALDPADKIGLGEFTKALLSSGTTTRPAAALAKASASLGDVRPTFLNVPAKHLDNALALMADQLLHPAFSDNALAILKRSTSAGIRASQGRPRFAAAVIFKRMFYGAAHPYAREQTEASVAALTRDDIVKFHTQYFRPPNVRFVVVGDITPEVAKAKLERHFGKWTAGSAAKAEVPPSAAPAAPTIYLYDQPKSSYSILWVAGAAPPRDTPDYAAISVMNTILGGGLDNRLNQALRNERPYAVGAQSEFVFRPVPQPGTFVAVTTVKAAVTDSALVVMLRALRDIGNAKPLTAAEFGATLPELTGQLKREFGTGTQRAVALMDLYANHLPLNSYHVLAAKLPAVTRGEAQAAAAYVNPGRFAIVVVGDRSAVEAPLRAANIAPVVVVDRVGAPAGTP